MSAEKYKALWKPFVEFTIAENMKTCNTTFLHEQSENKQAKDAIKWLLYVLKKDKTPMKTLFSTTKQEECESIWYN